MRVGIERRVDADLSILIQIVCQIGTGADPINDAGSIARRLWTRRIMVIRIQDVQVEQVVGLSDKKSDGVFLSRSDGDPNRRVDETQSQDGEWLLSPVSTFDWIATNE